MESVKTYLIVTNRGQYQIEIPESWRITYGPVSIGAKRGYGGDSELALRIYETETKQRAIFTGVQSFRDLSIPVKMLMISEEGGTEWFESRDESKLSKSSKRIYKWVDQTLEGENDE